MTPAGATVVQGAAQQFAAEVAALVGDLVCPGCCLYGHEGEL